MRLSRQMKISVKKFSFPVMYSLVIVLELILINQISTFNPALGNWEVKAREILSFQVPTDNFYGPGAALLLAPFIWVGPNYFTVNIFYSIVGTCFFWKITEEIHNPKFRLISRLSIPLNFYLLWLIHSSQDTVFEFALLSISIFTLMRQKYWTFYLSTFLLCETRSQYWIFFLTVSVLLYYKKRKILHLIPFMLLIVTSFFNVFNYGSPSPALEAGVTLELSYSKGYYLAHPKYDVDVFLDGPNGPLISSSNSAPSNLTQSESSRYYTEIALREAFANPLETILGFMQKVDSYFFITQKVPSLPGEYKYDYKKHQILIIEDRLNPFLVFGYLTQQIWRICFVVFGISALGILITFRKFGMTILHRYYWCLAPWACGAVAGIFVYTETRFKIVSEALLVPLICFIWGKFFESRDPIKQIN